MMSKFFLLLSAAMIFAGCALKGSKAEEKYEGRSNCSRPGFTCSREGAGSTAGLSPSADDSSDHSVGAEFQAHNKYAPICRLKADKCECACEPTN